MDGSHSLSGALPDVCRQTALSCTNNKSCSGAVGRVTVVGNLHRDAVIFLMVKMCQVL